MKKFKHTRFGRGVSGAFASSDGFAVPAAMLGMVSVSLLVVVALNGTMDERRGKSAIRSSVRPFYAAEAGLHQVLQGWSTSGYDGVLVNSGDSVVSSWQVLPNGCSWQSKIRRIDDGTGAMLFDLTVTGRDANGNASSERQLRTLLTANVVQLPTGIVANGDVEISGNPELTGCAGVYANGDLDVSGSLITDGNVEAQGSVSVGGSIQNSSGNNVTPVSGAPNIPIPELDPTSFCGEADWMLQNGTITNVATGSSKNINGNERWGWKYDSGDNVYEIKTDDAAEGTVCADGSVKFSDNPGTSSNPYNMTILAEGYVEISGNPFLSSSHSQGIQIVATGDLKLNGNSSFQAPNFGGVVYGGAQCEVSGTPSVVGSLICYDNPDPPGSKNLVDLLKFNGDMELYAPCGGSSSAATATPIAGTWSQGLR